MKKLLLSILFGACAYVFSGCQTEAGSASRVEPAETVGKDGNPLAKPEPIGTNTKPK